MRYDDFFRRPFGRESDKAFQPFEYQRRLREHNAEPESMETEAARPVVRTARAAQAGRLALSNAQGEDRMENSPRGRS